MTHRQRSNLIGYLFLAPYLVSFTIFVLVPVGIALWLAFVQLDLANKANSKFVGMQNFKEAVHDEFFWKATSATVHYAVLMVPVALIIGTAIALGLFGMSKGRDAVRALIYIPNMLNVAAVGILWQWFFNTEFGLINSLARRFGLPALPWLSDKAYAMPAVVITNTWWTIGGTAVIVLTALQQIPRDAFEAASLDGAHGWKMLSKITLPLMKPALLFLFITTTISAFQMFGQAMVLTGGGPEFSTRGLVQFMFETAFNGYRFGYGSAISWMLFALIGVFALLQARLMRSQGV